MELIVHFVRVLRKLHLLLSLLAFLLRRLAWARLVSLLRLLGRRRRLRGLVMHAADTLACQRLHRARLALCSGCITLDRRGLTAFIRYRHLCLALLLRGLDLRRGNVQRQIRAHEVRHIKTLTLRHTGQHRRHLAAEHLLKHESHGRSHFLLVEFSLGGGLIDEHMTLFFTRHSMDDGLGLIMIGQFMIVIAQLENIVQALRGERFIKPYLIPRGRLK